MSDPPRTRPDGGHDDDRHVRPGVEPVGAHGTPTAVWIVALLFVVLVGLAVIKPWEAVAGPSTESPDRSPAALVPPSTAPVPAPTPAPTLVSEPTDVVRFRCSRTSDWILVTDELQGARELRSWIRIDPVIGATGPDDPGIAWTRVGADTVRAIGACIPGATTAADSTPFPNAEGATLVVRRRMSTASGVDGWEVVPTAPYSGGMSVPGGAMVAPAEGTGRAGWPPGDYAVEVRPAHVGPSAWFGVRVAAATAGDASPGGPRVLSTAVP